MRTYATLPFCTLALFSFGQQCTVTEYPLGPGVYTAWEKADVYPDGGVIAVESVGEVFGDVLLTRLDAAGNTVWNKMLAPTNPTVTLEQPNQVLAMPDGGATVFGQTTLRPLGQPNGFHNMYGIRVDAQGQVLWARYFMYYGTYVFDNQAHSRMTALATNEVILAIPRETGLNLVGLDQNGMPVWERHYEFNTTQAVNPINGLATDDLGGMIVGGVMNNAPFIMRVEPTGDIDWMHHYDASVWVDDVHLTTTGDLLIVMDNTITRRQLDGTLIWCKQYSGFYGWSIRELPSGNFLASSGGINDHLEIDATGAVVAAWTDSEQPLIGVAANEVLFARGVFGPGEATPALARAWPANNLGCFCDPSTSNASVSADPPLLNTPVTVMGDTLRTWTMSLGGPFEYDQIDLEVMLNNAGARPGFQTRYSGLVRNNRGLASGAIETTLTYDPMLTFVAGTPTPTTVTGNTVTWSGQAVVQGLTTRQFIADFQVPQSAVVGEPLSASFTVTQDSTETSLANNTIVFDQIIVNSFDPNDKLVVPGDHYDPATDSTLHYTIRFQNTGTAAAITVSITDTLPPQVHASTFIPGPGSHPYTYSLTGSGILNFRFENINLPDSNANEPGSHGFVSFRIRPDETLLLGTEIRNAADIFFDFNDPIRTADAVVVFGLPTATAGHGLAPELLVHPVPARGSLRVRIPEGFVGSTIEIWTVDGRSVRTEPVNNAVSTFTISVEDLIPGTYLVKLRDEAGRSLIARFVKE